MLPYYTPDAPEGTRALNAQGSIYAEGSGVFEPQKTLGEDVTKGETVALLLHPDTPGKALDAVISPYGGLVLVMRARAQVRRGDALYQIAADAA
jgi:uncharacterized protein